MTKFLKHYWPTILTLGVVLYATLSPDPLPDGTPPLFPGFDKLIHAIMMGGLCGAIMFDYYRQKPTSGRLSNSVKLWVVVALVLFSGLDEILQPLLTDNRQGDFLDFLADLGGILVALVAAPPVIKYVCRKKRTETY